MHQRQKHQGPQRLHPILNRYGAGGAATASARQLLPNEPRVLDWPREQALTERFLLCERSGLEAFFLHVRTHLDAELQQAQPLKSGKPYPLGQCLEITHAVQAELAQLDAARLQGEATRGYAALTAFLQAGGSARQVWGDLRGQYFQNAFLVGTLYIDVSNDTVVPTKPKVEILPFVESQFVPVEDFRHFARIAVRYWRAHVFPNHLLPELAPFFPLITAVPDGAVRLAADSNYMFELAKIHAFHASEAVLESSPLPDDLFGLLAGSLAGLSAGLAPNPAQGRALALQYCRQFRAAGRHRHDNGREAVVLAMREANRRLAALRVRPAEGRPVA